jgi:hypothetical protein
MNTNIDPPIIAHWFPSLDDNSCFHRVHPPNNIARNKDYDGNADNGGGKKKKRKNYLCIIARNRDCDRGGDKGKKKKKNHTNVASQDLVLL